METLKVNEIFISIHGEGTMAGMPVIFIRLSGCNLRCDFCDTTYAYSEGNMMTVAEIASHICQLSYPWIGTKCKTWVCITGGEPLIQDVAPLVNILHRNDCLVTVETNGTQFIPDIFDHVVVSPKRYADLHPSVYQVASELKYIIEDESDFSRIQRRMIPVILQPVNNNLEIAAMCVKKVLQYPMWRVGLQLHKIINIK